ncbi:hypothetical protein HK405_004445, partial [Cladochytrium tenue]
ATSRTYRALVARVAVPRLLFLLSRLLFATVRLGNAAIAAAAAADVLSQRPPTAPSAASQLAGSAAFVAELVAAAARSQPAAASGEKAAAAAAIYAAMGAVWSHADAHWFFNGSDAVEVERTARRRIEALEVIEHAAAYVVRDEDGGDSDGDDAQSSVARGMLTSLSRSERLNMWRATVASGAENAEEGPWVSQLQWIKRVTFIDERLSPPDIEAALADIIAEMPADPCRCLGTAALFFWIDEDGNLITQENVEAREWRLGLEATQPTSKLLLFYFNSLAIFIRTLSSLGPVLADVDQNDGGLWLR